MRKYLFSFALVIAMACGLVTQAVLAQSDMDPAAAVEGLVEAWNAGDVDAAVAYFAEDAVVQTLPETFSPDGAYEGLDAIRGWIEADLDANTQVDMTIDEVDGNMVHTSISVTSDNLAALGVESITGTSDFVIEDGLIVEMVNTFDDESVAAFEEAMAAMEEAGMAEGTMDDGAMMEEDGCAALPSYDEVTEALSAVQAEENGGFGFDMWATLVDRSGIVCVLTRTGEPGEQWPGSRVISAQKANTANAFSLPGLAISTANLFNAVQPGNSLFGLQESNPVDTDVAYAGPAADWGTADDPMVGHRIGGVNVFGGGVALYDAEGELLGALGVSGDSSCADHAIAWKLRDALALDFVPGGVSDTGDDNMIFGLDNGFGHPECGLGELDVVPGLPESNPLE